MARQREYAASLLLDDASTNWFADDMQDLLSTAGEDFYDSVSPSENIWRKFDLLTPPLSPQRDDEDDDCFLPSPTAKCGQDTEGWLTTTIFLDSKVQNCSGGLKSKLIQDCMWSGSDEEQARSSRSRKVSLSELTMLTASTASVDPTTFSAALPRQQNQLEHSYSLTTPEPMRLPILHTPATTDESESEEDVIDVVTIDTRNCNSSSTSASNTTNATLSTTPTASKSKSLSSTQLKVRHDLHAVARRLNHESHKRPPKCLSDHDFALPSKKRKFHHHQQTQQQLPPSRVPSSQSSSVMSSQNSSDSEDFEVKRSAHNVMERQRRNDLKNSLHRLRDCLPSLETHERAPKVVILAHATDFVKDLQRKESKQLAECRELKLKNKQLKERLDYLQSRLNLGLV